VENPEPTEGEQEQAGTDRHQEEEDMRGADTPEETPTETGANG
jgi:hypothetical protein